MASTQDELDLAFVEVGTQLKLVRNIIGLLSNLNTTNKSSIVAAINELRVSIGAAGAVINDNAPSNSSVYSSSKTDAEIATARAALKSEILGGAGASIDTLKEIADLLVSSDLNDDNALAALTTAVSNRLRFDTTQTLTSAQKVQANANLGSLSLVQLGDPTHSYLTVFQNSLNATEEFVPGVTEVRYIPSSSLDVTDKNVGNIPDVNRTNATVSAFGMTQVSTSLNENINYTNSIIDVRGTGVITFRNCRFVLNSGYVSADSILALVRVLNGPNVTEVIFENCEFHNRGQRAINGISGRCVTLRECVFTGFVDAIRCMPSGTGAMTAATYGFECFDSWFGDFAWWRGPVVHADIHTQDLQVHADADQVGTTLGTTHHNSTFAWYVSPYVGTGTPGSGSDAGNPYSASYIVDQATMVQWRNTHCSTVTYAAESYDGQSHLLPNGTEGCSAAAVMINRAPVFIDGGHSYGSLLPINASDALLGNPVTNVTIEAMTFHNDMKNGPAGRTTDPTIKGYAIGTRAGRTYNIPTTGARRNVWSDGTTVIPNNIA